MAIPDFQSFMLPILVFAGDSKEHSLAEARDVLARQFNLTDEERNELLPSGRQRRFDNRVAWAKVYLEQAGLLSSSRRAHFSITDQGAQLFTEQPLRIDIPMLERYEEFRNFRSAARKPGINNESGAIEGSQAVATPDELLDQAYQNIRAEVVSDLLSRVKGNTPRFFENLVVELLLKMGYGRNQDDAARVKGGPGDEGIDGIISEDRLGLERIYIQAKRWEGIVGRPEIQKFVGALHGKRAKKGVFITTGVFSNDAKEYVSHIDPRVVLIDGRELAEYMLDFNLGVTTRATYELKRIDSDYFTEE